MKSLQVNSSPRRVEASRSEVGRCGPRPAVCASHRTLRMGAAREPAAFKLNNHTRRKFPVIQPLIKPRKEKSLISSYAIAGSPNLAKDDKLDSENNDPEDVCGRHFLFDQNYRTRTVIPPLPKDYRVHRPGNLHHFSLSKEVSHSHAVLPFTLGYELSPSPAILFPSNLFLNGRNTFSVENCKLSRSKVNYPTYNLSTAKANQKGQSFPDPMVGASRSFVLRLSELSSLEAETVRQERLKKMRKPRKPPS